MDDSVSNLFKSRYYTEFAVIEMDFDLEDFIKPSITQEEYNNLSFNDKKIKTLELKQERKNSLAIKNHLIKAIDELDSSIEKFKNGNYNMQLSNLPYATVDYGSVNLYINNYLKRTDDENIFNQPNTINLINKTSQEIDKYFADAKLNTEPL
ncbi:UNVERIFIED_CONTAM: hypothetical protein O8I53_11590 [Campylobacter lari]